MAGIVLSSFHLFSHLNPPLSLQVRYITVIIIIVMTQVGN